eukprot:scaffold84408_cov33-Tisochrysis_lutea.AAC.8
MRAARPHGAVRIPSGPMSVVRRMRQMAYARKVNGRTRFMCCASEADGNGRGSSDSSSDASGTYAEEPSKQPSIVSSCVDPRRLVAQRHQARPSDLLWQALSRL